MKAKALLSLAAVCSAAISVGQAAVVLSGTQYQQNFDGLASGLPTGWSVKTGATSTSLGTDVPISPPADASGSFVTTATTWGSTTGNFRNAASADGLSSTATSGAQSSSTDRALAIRQTASFGDPGAAFVLSVQDTLGFENFSLSFKAQMLTAVTESRSTTWTIDYRLGASGSFLSLGTYSDPGVFGSTTLSFTSTQLSAWNDQALPVYFRIAALTASSGSGNRDTFGIDDFLLTFDEVLAPPPVPEPSEWGLMAGAGLVCFGLWRKLRRPAQPVASQA